MKKYQLDIVCIQETWISKASYYNTFDNCMVILSGVDGPQEERNWTGVGFILSAKVRRSLRSFLQYSDRMACIKVQAGSNLVGILSIYAPHNMKPLPEKVAFYADLTTLYDRCSTDGPKIICGDFNARLGECRSGEDQVIGPHAFGREASRATELSNRELLLEFCFGHGLAVANTFADTSPGEKVTFREAGFDPMGEVCSRGYALLDLALVDQQHLGIISDLASHREATLATNHFLVTCTLNCVFAPRQPTQTQLPNLESLDSQSCRQEFISTVEGKLSRLDAPTDVDSLWRDLTEAIHDAEATLPKKTSVAKKAWVRDSTLALIEKRQVARYENDHTSEKMLTKQIKAAVRKDKSIWLDSALASGTWDSLKKKRRPPADKQGRMQAKDGKLVDSEERAATMALFLEEVQWQHRASYDTDGPALGEELPVDLTPFSESEVMSVLRQMKRRKAPGRDNIRNEYLKLFTASQACKEWLLNFLNLCWRGAEIPEEWHVANISMIFKKGSVSLPENYRPISLLSTGYKIFSALIRARLISAGAEDRLSAGQFGFRSGKSTSHAIFCLRRRIECEAAWKNGKLSLLALDWQRAFDSISSDGLQVALKRFGLPDHLLAVIANIYSERKFTVRECGYTSDVRQQASGIVQGCPLSPLLFIMLMTVVMEDVRSELSGIDAQRYEKGELSWLLYADDTILVGNEAASVERLLVHIQNVGLRFGLQLHPDKLQLLQIGPQTVIHRPDGSVVIPRDSMVYLGTLVTSDGTGSKELTRRLGLALQDFRCLSRFWRQAATTRHRKVQILNAIVFAKLRYSLNSVWLSAAERRRLDGFQNRCIRAAWGIKPAYFSRVANKEVLERSGQVPMSRQLLREHLLLFGEAARADTGSVLKDSLFRGNFGALRINAFVRKRGRPHLEWASEVFKHALRVPGGLQKVAKTTDWMRAVNAYIQHSLSV